MHDTKQKCIIPFAEFISTGHDQTTISKYLQMIKLKCENNSIKIANTIIVDQSWALINAVMISFNNCHISNYLNWCFIILFNKTDDKELKNLMKIRLFLCSTHFLKNFIKKSKSISCKRNVQKTFVLMLTLIQNSSTIKQIDDYLINIHNVFNNKYLDTTVLYSLDVLSKEIRNRKLCHIDPDYESFLSEQKERDDLFEIFLKESKIFISADFECSIKQSSPFTTHYEIQIERYNQLLKKSEVDNKNLNFASNEYFSPDIFKILSDQMYLTPLWTGVMLIKETIGYELKTRLSNNPVENWFGQVKNNMLQKKNSTTSEIVSIFYKNLVAKYFKNYCLEHDYKKMQSKEHLIEEKWSKDRKIPRFLNGFYYKNQNIFSDKTIYDYRSLNSIENHEFSKLFPKLHGVETVEQQGTELFEQHGTELFEQQGIELLEHVLEQQGINLLEPQGTEILEQQGNVLLIPKVELNKIEPIIIDNQKQNQNESILNQISVLNFIEDELFTKIQSNSFENIKKCILEMKDLFKKIIIELREIKTYVPYSNQKVYEIFKQKLGLEDNLFPIHSKEDGNCLYNSLALLLFSDESFYFIIKLCSIFILIDYENYFKSLMINMKYEYSFEEFLINTCKNKEWATEINVLSIAFLLNRSVFIYNSTNNQEINIRHEFSAEKSEILPILIGLCSSHFFPILLNEKIISYKKQIRDFKFLQDKQGVVINLYDNIK